MHLFTLISVLFVSQPSALPNKDNLPSTSPPNVHAHAVEAEDFVPSGWKSVALDVGDLNRDQIPDIALLMRMTDPNNVRTVKSSPYYKTDDTNPYMLVIGFATRGGYELVATHKALFPHEVAPMHGNDPPDKDTIAIQGGSLTLSLGYLRASEKFKFRWNGNDFALVGYDCAGVLAGKYSKLSANYLTGNARYERGPISSDKLVVSTVRIKPEERPNLQKIEPGIGLGTDNFGHSLGC